MSEKILSGEGYAPNKWEIMSEKENLIAEYYDQAVAEIQDEYKDKTPFEKKVMLDLIVNDEAKKRIQNESYWKNRFLGPSKERIKSEFEYDFDFGMNCGGFALEVFACLFPELHDIEEATKNIMKQFPFVRVLGEEGLRENEYPVIYRCNGNGGHHFVKIEGNKIIEKDGSKPVREFVEWPDSLKDVPEVVLAVNREHEIEPRDENGERIYSYWI